MRGSTAQDGGRTARHFGSILAALGLGLLLSGCGGGGGPAAGPSPGTPPGDGGAPPGPDPTPAPVESVLVLATAGRSSAWVDSDYSVFSLLPPHAILEAQVVRTSSTGLPRLLGDAEVALFYEAVPDPAGAVNSTSLAKTDFWDASPSGMYGASFERGEGFTGLAMPADAAAPGRQPIPFSAARGWFVADGVPLFPFDDGGSRQDVPYLRVVAVDRATGEELGHTDVPVPVSDANTCAICHVTGSIGTRRAGIEWSGDPDVTVQAKENVLRLHDARHGTGLAGVRPVPCALCHTTWTGDYGSYGGVDSTLGWPALSRALHGSHAGLLDASGDPVFPGGGTDSTSCALCHVSSHLSRGAMAVKGSGCVDCHGSMAAVGGGAVLATGGSLDGTRDGDVRQPWTDLPRCESCHTGDALDHLAGPAHLPAADGLRLLRAYDAADAAASPFRRDGTRFAPAADTRFSHGRGHGGLRCAACHGPAHAEWTRVGGQAMDESLARSVQGHAGVLVECSACHLPGTLAPTTDGPHGMHPAGDATWTAGGHGSFYAADPDGCRACHGGNLEGTVLSRAAIARTFQLPGRTVSIPEGGVVGCGTCHATHATDLAWVDGGHGAAYAQGPEACGGCHGAGGEGTALSTAAADRSYDVGGATYAIPAGTQVGCADCHVTHDTDLAWVDGGHGAAFAQDTTACASCHGADGTGTALSAAAADRSYTVGGKTWTLAGGQPVGCNDCHVPHATTSTWVTSTHGSLYESDPGGCTICHGADLKGTILSKTAASRTYTFGKTTKTFASGATVACSSCHVMHAISSSFVGNHESLYKNDAVACRLCHGSTLAGTSFSVTAADRSFTADGKTFTIPNGTKVSCSRCHEKP